MSVGRIDWIALAHELGTVEEFSEHSTAISRTFAAIIGIENIREAVRVCLEGQRGYLVAESVLVSLDSHEAIEMVYQAAKTGPTEQRQRALIVMRQLCRDTSHPDVLDWIAEFFTDDALAMWAMTVLDQLIWSHRVNLEDPRVVSLFAFADAHPTAWMRDKADEIRQYVAEREKYQQIHAQIVAQWE